MKQILITFSLAVFCSLASNISFAQFEFYEKTDNMSALKVSQISYANTFKSVDGKEVKTDGVVISMNRKGQIESYTNDVKITQDENMIPNIYNESFAVYSYDSKDRLVAKTGYVIMSKDTSVFENVYWNYNDDSSVKCKLRTYKVVKNWLSAVSLYSKNKAGKTLVKYDYDTKVSMNDVLSNTHTWIDSSFIQYDQEDRELNSYSFDGDWIERGDHIYSGDTTFVFNKSIVSGLVTEKEKYFFITKKLKNNEEKVWYEGSVLPTTIKYNKLGLVTSHASYPTGDKSIYTVNTISYTYFK